MFTNASFWKNINTWLLENERGQGLAEYAFILLLIVLVVMGILTALGNLLVTMYYQQIVDNFPG